MVVLPVGQHVERQSHAYGTQPPGPAQTFVGEDAHQRIEGYAPILMQQVKADAATVGVENRICQQVVQIHRHRRNHDEGCLPTTLPAEAERYQERGTEVEGVMQDGTDGKFFHCIEWD